MTYETARRKSQKILRDNGYHRIDRCCATCEYFVPGYEGEAFCDLAQVANEWQAVNIDYEGLCNKWRKPRAGGREGSRG
jgi:hypothetical protein